MRGLALLLAVLLLLPTVLSANIHGTVYDFNLDRVDAAVVEINTTPQQTLVAKNGSYSFDVSQGSYLLKAYTKNGEVTASDEEQINVSSNGSFVLDIILFPTIDFGSDVINTSDIDLANTEKSNAWLYLTVAVALLAFAVILFFAIRHLSKFAKKEEKKMEKLEGKSENSEEAKIEKAVEIEEADELDKIINFIKKEGGRTTQKDLRKAFPSSEAKISLMLSELEHKGIIEKIKKGRGNIIILKK